MSGRPTPSISPPTTTRVGGGRTARGAAVASALVLAAVVGLAIAGRAPDAATPSPTAAVIAVMTPSRATPTPTPLSRPIATGSSVAASPAPAASPFVLPSPRPGAGASLAVVLAAGADVSVTFLQSDPHGTLAAAVRVPFPRGSTDATLQVGEVRGEDGSSTFLPISSFRLGLSPRASGMVLDRRVEPHPELRNVPRLVQTGYVVRVLAESRSDEYRLWITINRGEATATLDEGSLETADGARARRPLTLGDDGLIGNPGAPNTP